MFPHEDIITCEQKSLYLWAQINESFQIDFFQKTCTMRNLDILSLTVLWLIHYVGFFKISDPNPAPKSFGAVWWLSFANRRFDRTPSVDPFLSGKTRNIYS